VGRRSGSLWEGCVLERIGGQPREDWGASEWHGRGGCPRAHAGSSSAGGAPDHGVAVPPALEASVQTLHTVVLLLLGCALALALTADGETVVVEIDLHVLFAETGQ
jgi:hypothetical protein